MELAPRQRDESRPTKKDSQITPTCDGIIASRLLTSRSRGKSYVVVAYSLLMCFTTKGYKMKKIEQVLNHLQTHGSITPKDAYIQYGYYRLSDGIWKLRNRGYNIITQEECHGDDKYARYVLIVSEEVAA